MTRSMLSLPGILPSESLYLLLQFFGWELHQMNVKTVFLNDEVEQEVYIEQPGGFVTHGK
jgi:hypothetical protein